MKPMTATLGAIAIALTTTACTQKVSDSGGTGKADNVAVIDGYKIPRSMYDLYVNAVSNGPDKINAQQKEALLENLVRGQILARAAEVNGVAKSEKVRNALELQRLNILSQAVTEDFLKDKKATEEEMRAEYQARLSTFEKTEYRASHILVKTEEEARAIIAQLKAGGNFAAIARAKSQDTVSKEKGGDLEWFSPSAMTPDFGNAVASLGKGDTSAAPVKTEYGYHVIRVTDIRTATPPSFESVKEQMLQAVDNKKVKAWVEELTKKAKITKTL